MFGISKNDFIQFSCNDFSSLHTYQMFFFKISKQVNITGCRLVSTLSCVKVTCYLVRLQVLCMFSLYLLVSDYQPYLLVTGYQPYLLVSGSPVRLQVLCMFSLYLLVSGYQPYLLV